MLARMRIASLVPERTVESIYRSFVPMQALAHRGHSVHIEERNDIRDPAELLDSDVVHVMRICHPLMPRLVSSCSGAASRSCGTTTTSASRC